MTLGALRGSCIQNRRHIRDARISSLIQICCYIMDIGCLSNVMRGWTLVGKLLMHMDTMDMSVINLL